MTSVNANANSGMGSKRGRLLIRQQRVKKDGDLTGDLETPEAGIYAEYLLSVPSSSTGAKMERHASEPSPATSSGLISTPSSVSGNLLSVPTHSSYLVKQHSHPLLPSQQPSTSYMLTRQYSQPIQTLASHSSQIITSSSVHTHEAQDIAASGQLLQFHHQKQPPVRSHTMPHYSVTDMEFGETTKVSSANVTSSPTVVIIPDMTNDPAHHHTTAQSHVITQQTIYQKSSSHHLQLPSIRVKSEELQRSISSPLVRFIILKLFLLKFLIYRLQHAVIYHSSHNRDRVIVLLYDPVLHSVAISVGIRLMHMEEFYDEKLNIIAPNARRIFALCHVSKNITRDNRLRAAMKRRCLLIKQVVSRASSHLKLCKCSSLQCHCQHRHHLW